ncbi:hypothetical protein MesoLjLc_01920 [Mesorhizobium sp. L-8-10]|nr:hypothetical protein MesoLjLc_01920 [Mesorhizobium sp. L-8-10]
MKAVPAGSAVSLLISEDSIMKNLVSWLNAAGVAAIFAVASVVPATGAPNLLPRPQTAHPTAHPLEVIQVRDGMRWRGNGYRGGGWRHGGNWRGRNWHGSGFRGGGYYGWYNGYGGYYDDDAWVAGGALLLGALIGSAIANSSYYGDYFYEDRYLNGGRYSGYRDRYSPAPYRRQTADPYLGWQRALDR